MKPMARRRMRIRAAIAFVLCGVCALGLLAPAAPSISYAGGTVRGSEGGGANGQARLIFVGDVMLGRYVGSSVRGGNYDAPFATIKPYLSSADLAIGNLEGPLVPRGVITVPLPAPNLLNLTGDWRLAPALARAGFDLMSVANNHALDSGQAGLIYTTDALVRAGISPFGLDSAGVQKPVLREVRGLRIAFLGYTDLLNIPGTRGVAFVRPWVRADLDRLVREVRLARTQADLVVVMIHSGTEYALLPNASQKTLARTAAGAGADLVVGSHPHVAQGIEVLVEGGRNTVVAYSLGNALFDQESRPDLRQGFALEALADRQGITRASLVPLQITAGKTYAMNLCDNGSCTVAAERGAQSTPPELQWSALWQAGGSGAAGKRLAYVRPGAPGTRSSWEDLGMGALALVQLEGGALSVSLPTTPTGMLRPVWVSEEGWRVTGYSVGDANADGKPDLIYTLWKKSLTSERPPGGGLDVNMQGGEVLPHIYISSWRDGALKPLWHGSPRPSPLLGVAVAPVGPSGKSLLATLESSDPKAERPPGKLSLWEWTGGFGFALYQQMPGLYSEVWSDGRALLFR